MESLFLANNLLTGKVSKSISSFRNLQFFNLLGNNFQEGLVNVLELRQL